MTRLRLRLPEEPLERLTVLARLPDERVDPRSPRMYLAVEEARQRGHRWWEIGRALSIPPPTARHLFGP